jgi:hypothetical protein
MSKHTPGPWSPHGAEVIGTENTPKGKGFLIVAKAGTWVEVSGTVSVHVSSDIAFANARLIAAAPDLLVALERMMKSANSVPYAQWTPDMHQADAAIRKAKGEA